MYILQHLHSLGKYPQFSRHCNTYMYKKRNWKEIILENFGQNSREVNCIILGQFFLNDIWNFSKGAEGKHQILTFWD